MSHRLLALILMIGLFSAVCLFSGCDEYTEEEQAPGGGVCYFECTGFTNVTIHQTQCYGQGGIGSQATDALQSKEECTMYAQDTCESGDMDLTQVLYDEDCISCQDQACEPTWTDDYE